MKTALITGQDGAYLAELLLSKGHLVHGIKRQVVNSTLYKYVFIYSTMEFDALVFGIHVEGDIFSAFMKQIFILYNNGNKNIMF